MQKGTKKFCVHVKVYIFNLLILFILNTLYVVTLRKSMKKNPEKIKKTFTDDYCILNIKLKIMLYEPLMLNIVCKSTERFGNLSLQSFHSPWKRMAFWNGKCIRTLSKWTVSWTFKNLTWEVFTWLNCTSWGNITSFTKYFMFGKNADVHGNLCTLDNVLYDPCRC